MIATNENDILARALETGRYEPREVMPTDSPSMDIQVSSNFERLLFEESGRDSTLVIEAMANLREKGAFEIPASTLARMRERFSACRVSRDEAASAMRRLFEKTGMLVDPHTAVGLAAARKEQERRPGPWSCSVRRIRPSFPKPSSVRQGGQPKFPNVFRRAFTAANASSFCRTLREPSPDTIETHASARRS